MIEIVIISSTAFFLWYLIFFNLPEYDYDYQEKNWFYEELKLYKLLSILNYLFN